MTPKEYEKNVLVTEPNDLAPIQARVDFKMIRLLHAALGLSSELAELEEAIHSGKELDWVNIMEEAGDLCWYTTVAVNALSLDHDSVSGLENLSDFGGDLVKHDNKSLINALAAVSYCAGNFNDLLKKQLFYGRELDMVKAEGFLKKLCVSISGLCYVAGYTIADSRETNIKKLKARYGEKFTEAAALNRNLENERKVLEGEAV